MSRHALFTAEEFVEQIRHEFTAHMADLENLEWEIRDLLDVVEELLTHQPAAA